MQVFICPQKKFVEKKPQLPSFSLIAPRYLQTAVLVGFQMTHNGLTFVVSLKSLFMRVHIVLVLILTRLKLIMTISITHYHKKGIMIKKNIIGKVLNFFSL